ncbi:retinaldehyde-binding protein 1-like [Parasteatoda tepidariorum]|uniref:retinaldehyde-binding protein 1-like n=1 Tax=Parasteatoda tepidariorum TaxID=114398 RepID=UPI0039BD1F3B
MESNYDLKMKRMGFLPCRMGYLTDWMVKVAEDELNETEETRSLAISEFRSLIAEQMELKVWTDDAFLLQFLRARKFDVKRAWELLHHFSLFEKIILKFIPLNRRLRMRGWMILTAALALSVIFLILSLQDQQITISPLISESPMDAVVIIENTNADLNATDKEGSTPSKNILDLTYPNTGKTNKKKKRKNRLKNTVQSTDEDCRWDPDEFSLPVVFSAMTFLLLQCIEDPATQVCGVQVIFDAKNISLKHIRTLSPRYLQLISKALRNTLPIRFKQVHVVNESVIFSYIFNIFKFFLTEKIKKRIHFHGSDMKHLHKYIPKEVLPAEYDGDNTDYCASEWVKKEAYSYLEKYKAMHRCGFR